MSCFRGIDIRIHRRDLRAYQVPESTRAPDIKAKYGMAVNVAEPVKKVSQLKLGACVPNGGTLTANRHRGRAEYPSPTVIRYTAGWRWNQRPESVALSCSLQ